MVTTQQVKVPKDGGWAAGVAVAGQILYSVLGLVVGIGVVVIGALLVIGGFTGQTDIMVKLPGDSEVTVNTFATGVVFALIGGFVFWITKYEVEMT